MYEFNIKIAELYAISLFVNKKDPRLQLQLQGVWINDGEMFATDGVAVAVLPVGTTEVVGIPIDTVQLFLKGVGKKELSTGTATVGLHLDLGKIGFHGKMIEFVNMRRYAFPPDYRKSRFGDFLPREGASEISLDWTYMTKFQKVADLVRGGVVSLLPGTDGGISMVKFAKNSAFKGGLMSIRAIKKS